LAPGPGGQGAATIRRKLAALSSLFEYLCESNAVAGNPVKGVKRPKMTSAEGKTPAIGDHQARALLAAPDGATVRGRRDRAILSMLLLLLPMRFGRRRQHGVEENNIGALGSNRSVLQAEAGDLF
jgi:integrase